MGMIVVPSKISQILKGLIIASALAAAGFVAGEAPTPALQVCLLYTSHLTAKVKDDNLEYKFCMIL